MLFPRSPLCRAVIAAALALSLAGCGSRGARASAVMLSGGGSVDHHQEASDHPEASSSGGASEAETPSFQELPSSSESSSSSEAAPSTSSSEVSSSETSSSEAPSSSSQAPVSSQPPASSQPEEQQPDDEEEQPDDDEEEPDDDENWDDQDEDNEGDEDDEPEEDEPDDDRYNETSDWEDLKVRSGGSTVSDSAVSIVARIVQTEMGSSFPDEALKAQAVAAYTFVRYHNSVEGNAPSVILSTSSNVSDRVNRLVREVAGEQISYNGRPILATYCAMSAGTTTSAQSVWGSALPYLVPVESPGDKKAANYCVETTMTASSVRKKLENYLDVDLDGVSPKNWFDILSYWDGGPYVNKVSIAGQKETTGRVLRESILGLRSAAFEVEYDKVSNEFTFTTYGYGHGVGMSQMGAKYYADQGWDYVDILEHYYSGTTVG